MARTLSQCRGFSFGLDPFLSSIDLTPLLGSFAFEMGLPLFDSDFITLLETGEGVYFCTSPNFLRIDSCGGGGGGGGGGGVGANFC